jgi:tRNA modification GTPase
MKTRWHARATRRTRIRTKRSPDARVRTIDTPDYIKDTIVAAATPPGRGGVGIVRISGQDAEQIASAIVGTLPQPRHATRATFRDAEQLAIDSGLVIYFPGSSSFTGEPVVELQGHGGPIVMSLLITAAIASGARRAEPGEFTQRAFLNGKLDLVQAESIADLIASGTAQAARAAHRSLAGDFSARIDALREKLIRLRLHVEAAIDFPEEEIDFLSDTRLLEQLHECAESFGDLIEQTAAGKVLRDGFQIVIVGKPNAGKSSLMNFLSGEETAIVTEYAGTTRDILREQIDIDGLAVEIIDTAGLRDKPDVIEAEGIRRAREALGKADAALLIQDANLGEDRDDYGLPEDIPVIVLRNKIDLSGDPSGVVQTEPPVLNVSVKTGDGIDALRASIKQMSGFDEAGGGTFTARKRHLDALNRAAAHFQAGREALEHDKAGELLAEELRLALAALGSITGEFSSDDLLGRIFAEFCVGK